MGNMYGKGAKGKATRLHALIVRDRGACENCGTSRSLQCAHIISRKYSQTRTDLDNAFCLCASCHMHFTDNPVEFGNFVNQQIGEEAYAKLIQKRNVIARMDWETEADRLQAVALEKGLL